MPRFEMIDDIAVYRADASVRFQVGVDAVALAIRDAVALGHRRMLVDAMALAALPPPTVSERMAMAREWAGAAQGRIRIAVATPHALLDPQRIGVVAATGFGLQVGAFASIEDAMGWLRDSIPR